MLPLLVLLAAAPVPPPPPRLTVLVVIDQLAARDFDTRLPKTTGGIKRMASEGFRVRALEYLTAPTVTSAGHATLATGAWPETHGIVSNQWWDEAAGRPVLSTEDDRYRVVTRESKPRDCTSPLRLMTDTLGDALKSHLAGAKVASVAGKDRAAILLGGRAADLALWLDAEAPVFTTSTFYAQQLPAWVAPINEALLTKIPPAPQLAGRQGDSEPLVERIEIQPAINQAQIDLALEAVRQLQLGQDDVPDLLTISFSGHDRVGHAVGPDAPAAVAEFMTIDQELGRLMKGLDQAVGVGRYTMALTSDHGVAPVPEELVARRLDAGRVDGKAMLAALDREADAALGPGDWFISFLTPGFFEKPELRGKLDTVFERLRATAKKTDGVLDLFSARKLLEGGALTPMQAFYRRGLYPGRSPDLLLVTRPYWLAGKDVAAHSTGYTYDREVPLLLWGAGVKKGGVQRADAVDLAPTLGALLKAAPPAGSVGRVLTEALAEPR